MQIRLITNMTYTYLNSLPNKRYKGVISVFDIMWTLGVINALNPFISTISMFFINK